MNNRLTSLLICFICLLKRLPFWQIILKCLTICTNMQLIDKIICLFEILFVTLW